MQTDEDIPNKIQSGLGIVADVNKYTKDYLEIKVKPSAFPISYAEYVVMMSKIEK